MHVDGETLMIYVSALMLVVGALMSVFSPFMFVVMVKIYVLGTFR